MGSALPFLRFEERRLLGEKVVGCQGGMEDAQTGETPCRCQDTLVCRAGQGKQGDGRRQRQGAVCEEVRKGAWPRWGKAGFPFLQKGGNIAGKEGEGEGGRERGEGEEKGRAKGDLK